MRGPSLSQIRSQKWVGSLAAPSRVVCNKAMEMENQGISHVSNTWKFHKLPLNNSIYCLQTEKNKKNSHRYQQKTRYTYVFWGGR